MTRLLLIAALVAGCGKLQPDESDVAKCHAFGYFAWARPGHRVQCCSKVNGDDVCLDAYRVTRHRRETGQ